MALPHPVYLYKIRTAPPVPTAIPPPIIARDDDDKSRPGWVHLCRARQLAYYLNTYYTDAAEVVILKLIWEGMKTNIRWDRAENGDYFPNYFRDLTMSDINSWKTLKRVGSKSEGWTAWEDILEREKAWIVES